MPKLLQIDSCLGVYSTGRITEGIAAVAMRRGWDCYIAHGARCIGKTIQHSYQITRKYEEYFHYANSFLFDEHGLHSTHATRKLVSWIDKISPDVVNLHCIHGYHLNYKVLFEYLASRNILVVWTFHDCWSFTGHCAHYVSIDCNKWKTGCHHCGLQRDYPKCIGIDNSKRNYELKKKLFLSIPKMNIVSVSKWLDGVVEKSFFKFNPRHVIYNGIDTSVFCPIDSQLREKLELNGKFVLLAVASAWNKAKGLDDYITLSKRLSKSYKIVLVGIPDDIKANLPSEILALPRTNSAKDLAEIYSMADICLNLSYQETFGLTTAEAMACGTPGIVYNRTASPELITPDTGFVIPPGDIDKLIESIKIIQTYGKAHYSTYCRTRALSCFDREDRFNDYVNLYEELINQ